MEQLLLGVAAMVCRCAKQGNVCINVAHSVTAVNSDQPDVRGFDIVHVFNCRIEASSNRWPVAKTPVYQLSCLQYGSQLARAIWGSRGTGAVLRQAVTEGDMKAASLPKQLKELQLEVQLPQGIANAEGAGDCWPVRRQVMRELLRQVDGLLPNSWIELQSLRNDLQWDGDCFEIAHYGVDPKLFLDADPEPFRQQTGIKGPFVLQAGRIEPSKNQAMLCWALKDTKLPIVFIGSSQHWPSYAGSARQSAVII